MNNQYQKIINFIIQERSCINNMLACKIALKLMPYSNALIELIEIKNLGKEQEPHNNIIIQTIEHDYIGLKYNDDDFLPRLKKNIS